MAVHVREQVGFVGMSENAQPHLACFSSDRSSDRGVVVVVVAMTPPVVGAPSRRVSRVEVPLAFFLPRFAPSHQFRYAHLREAH
jgi:hypothetical protein